MTDTKKRKTEIVVDDTVVAEATTTITQEEGETTTTIDVVTKITDHEQRVKAYAQIKSYRDMINTLKNGSYLVVVDTFRLTSTPIPEEVREQLVIDLQKLLKGLEDAVR